MSCVQKKLKKIQKKLAKSGDLPLLVHLAPLRLSSTAHLAPALLHVGIAAACCISPTSAAKNPCVCLYPWKRFLMLITPARSLSLFRNATAAVFQNATALALARRPATCFRPRLQPCSNARFRLAHSSRSPLDPNSNSTATVARSCNFVPVSLLIPSAGIQQHVRLVLRDRRRSRTDEQVSASAQRWWQYWWRP